MRRFIFLAVIISILLVSSCGVVMIDFSESWSGFTDFSEKPEQTNPCMQDASAYEQEIAFEVIHNTKTSYSRDIPGCRDAILRTSEEYNKFWYSLHQRYIGQPFVDFKHEMVLVYYSCIPSSATSIIIDNISESEYCIKVLLDQSTEYGSYCVPARSYTFIKIKRTEKDICFFYKNKGQFYHANSNKKHYF